MDKRNLAILAIAIASAAMLTLGCASSTPGTTPSATSVAGQGDNNVTSHRPNGSNSTPPFIGQGNGTFPGYNESFNGSMGRGRNGTWPDFNGTDGGPMMQYNNTTRPGQEWPNGGQGYPQ